MPTATTTTAQSTTGNKSKSVVTQADLQRQSIAIANNSLPEGESKQVDPWGNQNKNNYKGLSDAPVRVDPFYKIPKEEHIDPLSFYSEGEDMHGGNENNRRVAARIAADRAALAEVGQKPAGLDGDQFPVSDAQRAVKQETGDGVGTEAHGQLTPNAAAAQEAQKMGAGPVTGPTPPAVPANVAPPAQTISSSPATAPVVGGPVGGSPAWTANK